MELQNVESKQEHWSSWYKML